jgi:hypothetical protein
VIDPSFDQALDAFAEAGCRISQYEPLFSAAA